MAARAGLHTGECEIRAEDLAGEAIEVARRVAALAANGEVLVSRTVRDLVAGASIDLAPRAAGGTREARELFAVGSPAPQAAPEHLA